MNWRTKARIQNVLGKLPTRLSYGAYYWIQRSFGNLRRANPLITLQEGLRAIEIIDSLGKSPVGCTFFDLGTGHRIVFPLVCWLLGAEKIFTVDLNPYLREAIVREDLEYIKNHREQVRELFAGRIYGRRFEELLPFIEKKWRLADLLEFCHTTYLAPCDAAELPIASQSVDCYTSFVVIQHIPPETLKKIIAEGNRVVKSGGVFLHHIDHSDQFSHVDPTISAINFLQFDEAEWKRLAGNRYAYASRLRHDDYEDLFRAAHHEILFCKLGVDPALRELLEKNELKLAERFATKSKDVLAATSSWIVSKMIAAQEPQASPIVACPSAPPNL